MARIEWSRSLKYAHELTVTEVARSKPHAHVDGAAPVTLEMDVTVRGAGMGWPCRLWRAWMPELYGFDWRAGCEFSTSDREAIDGHIAGLAEELGAYFDPERHEDMVSPAHWVDIPGVVRETGERYLRDYATRADEEGHPDDSAEFAADEPYVILLEGEVVGYILPVGFVVDHPLFAGGGAYLYINARGRLVSAPEWWG